MNQIQSKFKNRDGDLITFKLNEESSTVEMTDYSTSFIRTGEPDITEIQKKQDPNREKILAWIDVPGGPFIACGFDLNAFLYNGHEKENTESYLNQDHRKIITKIDVKGPKIIFSYESKKIKK